MATLVDLEDARLILGFGPEQDDFYQFLINSASAYIERKAKMKFPSTAIIQQMDGGFNELILRNRPIVSVTSITDFADLAFPVTIAAADYTVYPETGIIRYTPRGQDFSDGHSDNLLHFGTVWAQGARRWEVDYIAGYATGVPEDIQQATIMLISYWAANKTGGAFESESIGDYSYKLGATVQQMGGIPPTVNDILKLYTEVSF